MNTSTESIDTPAFIYDETRLINELKSICELRDELGFKLLFSLKACSQLGVINIIASYVDGYSCSSIFEAKLADEVCIRDQSIHFTSPGMKSNNVDSITDICRYINFNTISQLERIGPKELNNNYGLRINTKLSFLEDSRYDPSRKHSKLGISIQDFSEIFAAGTKSIEDISGLHFHNNSESHNFEELYETVCLFDDRMAPVLKEMKWINMGGGYLFNNASNMDRFYDSVTILKEKYDLEVFIEPGASLVNDAAVLVASVVDLMVSDGKAIAVLDTTINHLPEVYEYQYEPEVQGNSVDGDYEYILAGCSCLAGDIFGEYSFEEPLEIGSKITISSVGAYSLVKANMFNGINLPNVYLRTTDNKLKLVREYTYQDYRSRLGDNENEIVRERNTNLI